MRVIKATNTPVFAALVLAIVAGRCAASFYVSHSAVLPACSLHISKVCDESLNTHGANKCDFDGDCAGNRSCSYFGFCEGESDIHVVDLPAGQHCKQDPLPACSDHQSHICDESRNIHGANRCKVDGDCFSGRSCSAFGWCDGKANAELVDCEHVRRLQTEEATYHCGSHVDELSAFLSEAGVSVATRDSIISDVNNENTTLEVAPEDNELTDNFANLNDDEYNILHTHLASIIASVPSSHCHALEVELTKINAYLTNSRNFNTHTTNEQQTEENTAEVLEAQPEEHTHPDETQEQTETVANEEQVHPVVAEQETMPVESEEQTQTVVNEEQNAPEQESPEQIVTQEDSNQNNTIQTAVAPEEQTHPETTEEFKNTDLESNVAEGQSDEADNQQSETVEVPPPTENEEAPGVVTTGTVAEEPADETAFNPEELTESEAKDLEVLISQNDLSDPEIPADVKEAEKEILEFAEHHKDPNVQTVTEKQPEENVVTSSEETAPTNNEVTVAAAPPAEENQTEEVTEQTTEEPATQTDEQVVEEHPVVVNSQEQTTEEQPVEDASGEIPSEKSTEEQSAVVAPEEQPSEEKPADEKTEVASPKEHPTEQPTEEHPTDEHPTEETTEEHPTEHPTEEHPTEQTTEEQPNEEHPTEETTEEHPAEQTTEEHPTDQTTEEVVTSEHPDENQTSTVETQVEDTSVTEIPEPETEVNNFNAIETSQENNTEDENEAYKLVLAAMQSSPDSPEQTSLINVSPLFASSETPSVETTEGETTETPVAAPAAAPSSSEVSPKLNNAVQQLLSLSDEFASKFMAYGGSDGKTINEVIDDFAVDLFTDEELKVDGVPAEWNVQGAVPAKVDAEIEVIEKEVKDLEQVAESSVINTSIKEQQQTVTEAEPTQTEETTAEVEPIQAEETTTEVEPIQNEETTAEVEPIQAEETTTEVEPIQAEETTHEVEPTQTEETTHEVEPTQTEETTTVNSTPVQEVSNEEQSTEQQSGIEQEETVASTEEQQGEHEPTEVEETVASTEEQQGEHEPTEVEETFASEKPTVTEEIAPIENEPAVLVLPQTPVEEQNNVVDASLPEENKVVEESAAAQEENSNTVEEPFGDDEHPVEFEAPAEQPVASEGEETAPVNEQILDEHIAPIESQITATEHAPAEDETLTELLTTENPENETAPEHTSGDNEPAVSETGLRMLTILKLYKEHVNYRDSEHIVDHRHYGHLRNFQRHLSCLTDNSCDFSKHLHLMEREHQERITQQSRHLEATQTTEERGFFGKVWCGIRKFFRRPCPEAEKVAVQATVASPSHLEAATESRGWFGRAWCSVRKFFRRPCPESEVQPVVVQTTTTSTTTQAHLFADEEETGFFTFMTSRKLAHYLNNAEKHLIAHKQEDDGSHSETEESAVNTDEEITEEHPVESEETQTENVQAGEDNQETVVAEEETAESEPVEEPTITVGSSEEPTEESALANNTDAFRDAIKQLIQQLPECISNEDIKEVSHNFIDKAHEWLTQNDQAFPQTSKNIAHTVDIVKFASELGSNITPVQLKAVIDSIHTSVVDKIKQNFNSDSLAQEASQLESLRDHFDQLKNALRSYLPVDSVLEKDLEELVDKLDNQVKVHYEAKDASEEDIAAAREYLIKSFDAEFNGIDTNTASEKVKSIMTSLKSIVNGNFGKSLNEENLNFIVHRVVQAFHADLERTKDASKASDFVIDTDDLDLLVDNIIDELKKSREANQKAIIDLRDFHRWVQAENKKLDFNVDTGNKALDAAESLIKYENAVYDTLGSAEFSEQLKNYVSKYYNVLKAHTKPWSPLVVYSQAYKALTKDITEVNPFPQESTVVNRRALHMMRSAIGSQIRHMDKLSQEDRKFFQFFNSLLAEWTQSKDENAFARKLDQIIRSLQGRQTGLRNLTLVKADPSHKLLDKITQFKDSLTNIVGNLGTTYDNAIKLSETIGEGKTLAQQAKDFFTLKNPILSGNTQQTSGFFGKVKSWFGGRRLEKHFGVTETFESLKNLYNDLDTAHKTAEELKKNVETAKSFANGVKDVFNAVGGIVA